MSLKSQLGELLKIGFMSDSGIEKFFVESGIFPKGDYPREIAQNTAEVLKANKETAAAMQDLAKAIAELKETIGK